MLWLLFAQYLSGDLLVYFGTINSQYQVHFVFAVDHIEEENDETFAPLLVSATAVTAGDYRVDYTMSNLSEVTSPLKSVEQLRSLILKGPSVHELSLALVQPIIDLKLQYLLCRLPSFPPNMVRAFRNPNQTPFPQSSAC